MTKTHYTFLPCLHWSCLRGSPGSLPSFLSSYHFLSSQLCNLYPKPSLVQTPSVIKLFLSCFLQLLVFIAWLLSGPKFLLQSTGQSKALPFSGLPIVAFTSQLLHNFISSSVKRKWSNNSNDANLFLLKLKTFHMNYHLFLPNAITYFLTSKYYWFCTYNLQSFLFSKVCHQCGWLLYLWSPIHTDSHLCWPLAHFSLSLSLVTLARLL